MRHITIWRRLAISSALAIATIGPGASAVAQSAPPTSKPKAPPGTAPGLKPGDPVINSWALAPTANDPSLGGNRPNLSYEVAAGADITDQVTLYNLSNVPLNFKVYATDGFNDDDGGFDLLAGDKKPTDVGTWVTLPQQNITLAARTQATMHITIKVPVTAAPGDHVGGILASSAAVGSDPNGKIVTLDRRTGSRLYVRVAGPLAPKLAVEKLSSHFHPALNPFGGTTDVTYRVVNRGNVRMVGTQQLSVSGPLGLFSKHRPSATIPELIPGQGYTVHATFPGVFATGLEIANVHLNPALTGSLAKTKSDSWRSFALAPPYTVLALALSIWLLLRARRSYLRRRGGHRQPGALPVQPSAA